MGPDSESPLALTVVVADDQVVTGPASHWALEQPGHACWWRRRAPSMPPAPRRCIPDAWPLTVNRLELEPARTTGSEMSCGTTLPALAIAVVRSSMNGQPGTNHLAPGAPDCTVQRDLSVQAAASTRSATAKGADENR
jgi:hypothetical protein